MLPADHPVLQVNGLSVSFRVEDRWLRAVDDVSFGLYRGRTLALVGESGSGKSVTSMAVMGLLPGVKHCRVEGKALLAGPAARDGLRSALPHGRGSHIPWHRFQIQIHLTENLRGESDHFPLVG